MTLIDPTWMAALVREEKYRGPEVTRRGPWKTDLDGAPLTFATDGFAALVVEADLGAEVCEEPVVKTIREFALRDPRGGGTTVEAIKAWAATYVPPPPTPCTRCGATGTIECMGCGGTGKVERRSVACDDCGEVHQCIADCYACDEDLHQQDCPDCVGGVVKPPPMERRAVRVQTACVDAALVQKFAAGLPEGAVRVHVAGPTDANAAVELYGDGWRLFVMPVCMHAEPDMTALEVGP